MNDLFVKEILHNLIQPLFPFKGWGEILITSECLRIEMAPIMVPKTSVQPEESKNS